MGRPRIQHSDEAGERAAAVTTSYGGPVRSKAVGLGEIAAVFVRLGVTAFGGPAAHIAMMRREVVQQRQWEDERTFLDLVGLTALLPGPNSTELAIELGRRRGGRRGLIVAGAAFILPAVLIVTAIAWAYERVRSTSELVDLRTGILPVVVAIIAHAAWKLGRTAVRSVLTGAVAVLATVAAALDVHELVILAAGAVSTFAWAHRRRAHDAAAVVPLLAAALAAPLQRSATTPDVGLVTLWWSFLRIGATLFGSGYVLVAMLESEFVDRLGVLSSAQLLDAVAIGQVTPGPVFTTATFIGYLLEGLPGAAVASAAIFLPAFVLVAALGGPLERWLRRPAARALLDGLNAAAVGLIVAAAWSLIGPGIDGVLGVVLAAGSLIVLALTDINPTWLIAVGLAVGLAQLVTG